MLGNDGDAYELFHRLGVRRGERRDEHRGRDGWSCIGLSV